MIATFGETFGTVIFFLAWIVMTGAPIAIALWVLKRRKDGTK